MVKIECILRPEKLESVKHALTEFGIRGMTISQVTGCGAQKGHTEFYRGTEISINLLPKIKVEIVTNDDRVDTLVKIITEAAHTGAIGDGKIFIYPLNDAVRVRTGETGEAALK
ncbi:MAG TPA: P-II family nitrogen regulator [Syntrophomonadaceae bacterium]|nr:P-II family nitrogen regulator [Syntrophomonadaceae bacterium]